MKEDIDYLEHILECLNWISSYVDEGEENFFKDHKTQSAVLRDIQTLSESVQRLSPEIKETHPEVFWQGISGFRNMVVHNYLGIKLDRVWEIIKKDLPVLRAAVIDMQKKEDLKRRRKK